jgi:membrane-bound lytic murein transglycosylase MltF
MNKNMSKAQGTFLAILIIVLFAINLTEAQAVESVLKLDQKWVGDFDGMVERGVIRALVPYSKTFYFLDGADQRGLTYELLRKFEKQVNKESKRKRLRIRLVVIPTKRDRLLPALLEGLGDIAAGNLTITPERQTLVDFAAPSLTGVDEIIVTGPTAPPLKSIEDLAGKPIHVRASSSYYDSLQNLNARFEKEEKKRIERILVDEHLEDEDLLEMMNAGLISIIVMDSHKAQFWSQVFKDLKLHLDISVRTGGNIAWAMRKDSPELKKVVDSFVESHKKGTLTGNILFKRYLQNTRWVRNSVNEKELQRLKDAAEFFRKYSDQYEFDWLMVAALAYQESGIDQRKRSPAGAVGVMQVLPKTAADRNINIDNIDKLENNIHAGVKYLRFIKDRYFETQPMDGLNKMLFTFASYNAGPSKVSGLRREAEESGLDPNVWFGNVEIVAAKRIGQETVRYVSNIYKYYVAYRLIVDKLTKKREAKTALGK